jgi:hypothetical protein
MTALCQKSGARPGKYPVDQQLHQKAPKRPQRALSTKNGNAKGEKEIKPQLSQANGQGIG